MLGNFSRSFHKFLVNFLNLGAIRELPSPFLTLISVCTGLTFLTTMFFLPLSTESPMLTVSTFSAASLFFREALFSFSSSSPNKSVNDSDLTSSFTSPLMFSPLATMKDKVVSRNSILNGGK